MNTPRKYLYLDKFNSFKEEYDQDKQSLKGDISGLRTQVKWLRIGFIILALAHIVHAFVH